MAFIIVEPTFRDDQLNIIVVNDSDVYEFFRTHRRAPIQQCVEIIKEHAKAQGNPPILIKVDNSKCALIAAELKDYPRLVKARA